MPVSDRKFRVFVPSASELLNDSGRYGEGVIALNLLSELAHRGHELVVCAREVELSRDPPFELVVVGYASRFESVEPLTYMRRVQRICRQLGRSRPFDVAHWIYPDTPGEMLFSPPDGLPLVIGPKGAPWPAGVRNRPFRAGDAVRSVLRPVFAHARARTLDSARVVMGSTPAAVAGFPAERFRVVPLGIDLERFAPSSLPDEPRILFAGRVDAEKGVPELLEAFVHVRARIPDAQLDVAGSGTLLEWSKQRVAALGVGDAVTFHGLVAQAQMPDLLRRASLLCLPTHADAFGMIVVEAMAAGRAVVASDVNGPRFVLGDEQGGRLVPPRNAVALADALATLLADREELARMGAHNRRRVEERFSLALSADAVEEAYADALEAR